MNHPLSKNHKIQLKPTSFPEGIRKEISSKFMSNYSQIGIKSLGCPPGTVPILRVQKDVLRRSNVIPNRPGTDVPYSPGHHIIVAQTKINENMKYHGTRTYMAVYTPKVTADQFSEGAIWITNQLNSIRVGWTVNPTLYGDNRTHLFGYWTVDADGFNQTGCFDIRCAGFVQISAETTLGLILEPTSHGRVQYEGLFHVFQDSKTGDWWLSILPHDLLIGYWPKYLFTSLASHANEIAWGGEVFSPLNEPSPPMGSGQFVIRDMQLTCYARAIQIIDEYYNYKDLRNTAINIEGYNSKCYGASYVGFRRYIGYIVLFGGAGGGDCSG
ncbi:hypothetical protein IFM89_037023 [Coptis chinensis]|uniref:Neprosin PEP catalytic domain-containing protein n=1 Tax=Coptis chinensis TaxID=261450 RepID=A0A835HSC4_9MAGN|nr:hypothetical protein IFM89_037023 [Coptis chinensis]